MPDLRDLLTTSTSFLLVDWPDRDVPETLARHGYRVVALEGPDIYNAYEMADGQVHVRQVDKPNGPIDIVYAHRPVDELAEIVEQARALDARSVWLQSGRDGSGNRDPRGCWLSAEDSTRARQVVESAELVYVDSPYLPDAVREALGF
jgi:hypothetical protein